ncbi:NF038215 family lipoprotein [Acinetobacter thermotolerans]|uniref:NF038215 family lipoprotein n=1 Tax=Acinetobacter thermotolerans TaxID=3151487 RepID=UPI00325A5885
MKKLSYLLFTMLLSSLTGCDNDHINQPKTTEARTMIIGGVPVQDRDYRLPQPQIIAQDIQQR